MPQSDRWLPALDDRPGPAAPISDERARAMVDAAIGNAFAPAPRPRLVRRPRTFALAAAATLAAAAAVAGTMAWKHRAPAPTVVTAPTNAPSPVELPLAPPVNEAPPPPPSASINEALVASAPPSSQAAHGSNAAVADLLARANALRAARRWREAAQTYERIAATSPGSYSGYAADVAAADLHLDQLKDPAGALRLYRAARAGRAEGLGEQILWGIARGTRALGDARAEESALREYVGRYPAGLFAAESRERLARLSPPP